MRKQTFCIAKSKAQISIIVTAEAFVSQNDSLRFQTPTDVTAVQLQIMNEALTYSTLALLRF